MSHLGSFDLAVVGGGVNGAGIARDAAGRGLSVLLIEKDDLAQGTSSRSSKLVHGGLRYLEQYAFRLVRESLAEREILLRTAPHLVRPMRFVLPQEGGQRPGWLVRLGLLIYDHMGSRKILPASRALDLARAPEGFGLRREFRRGFAYSDCAVDDARLVVANALDARRLGARIETRTALVGSRRDGGAWRLTLKRESGEMTVEARALVNAAGPWTAEALSAANAKSEKRLRLVKGSHLVTRKFWQGEQAYLLQNPDRRVVFVTPYEGDFALIGTTDVPFAGRPEDAAIAPEETDYLLAAVRRYFAEAPAPADILDCFSGVRALLDDGASEASAVTRDYDFELDAPVAAAPLLSVFGGKLTTYRRLAEQALARLSRAFPAMGPAWTKSAILPGGALDAPDFAAFLAAVARRWPWLPSSLAEGYARRYGARIAELIDGATSMADLGRHFGDGLYEREARFVTANEWAESAEDILERRTKHHLRLSAEERRSFEAWLAAVAGGREPRR
ncbi:MAG: glycerol-3-phosphate dehydrogenase [Hyphomicrobiales bacterium]|nr:glycerol-3-phosphate dehydrogenase [Hyphomicrobiales bacterium]